NIGGYSVELCGGIHVENISKIGVFKIVSEGGVAAGVRRIEAMTSFTAYSELNKVEKTAKKIAKELKVDVSLLDERVEKIIELTKDQAKEIEALKSKLASFEAEAMFSEVVQINGVKVLIKNFVGKDADYLREITDKAKAKLISCVVVLGSDTEKAVFAVGVTKDLISKVKAGDLVREAAKIAGGNGGGRPDFAQAGGKDGNKVIDALNAVREILKNSL
ncbi:MAG: DHHA1 domain-containing protein, partial [Fusobacteriaceae bacterium]